MKKWLVHKRGVVEVEVLGPYSHDTRRVAVVIAGVGPDDVRAADVFGTEAEARREHVDREACALEELADKHDRQRVEAEELAKGHMDDAEWNRAEAAALRARAKGLRDALEEVKDATEGRR